MRSRHQRRRGRGCLRKGGKTQKVLLSSGLGRCLKSQARKEATGVSIENHPNQNKKNHQKNIPVNRPTGKKGKKNNIQPQTVRLRLAFVTIRADGKGGEERSLAKPHRCPGAAAHRHPILVTIPVVPRCLAIPTGRQGTRSLLPPLPIRRPSLPLPSPLPISSRPPGRTPRWPWRWCSGTASSGRPGAWRTTGRWGSSGGVTPWGRRASSWHGWRR